MTMPHLMNCPHTEAGWCGECVIALWEEKEKFAALATQPQAPQGGEAEIDELKTICAETYQVVGSLASDLGIFGSSEQLAKVLDNLSQQKRVHADVLPWPSFEGPWRSLTDADRERAFNSLPDMLDGFLKKWGWLHFAQAIEDICREKNAAPTETPEAGK
jgi:hypothetical protein